MRSDTPGHDRLDRVIALLILLFVLIADVYRAATQSIVYDEAASYLNFIHDSVATPLMEFNAANHVLFSILAAVSTHSLGPSEFTLRLPSVLGAAGYLTVVYPIARRLCGGGVFFVAAVLALSLNPVVFDFMSAARGYGLALFWFALALAVIARGLIDGPRPDDRSRTIVASFALGLSVCSNLAFLFPVAGLFLGALVVVLTDRSLRPNAGRIFIGLLVPGAVACAVILALPLRNVRRDLFYFGADSLLDTAGSLVSMSLAHHPTWWTTTRVAAWLLHWLPYAVVLPVAVAVICALGIAVRRREVLAERQRFVLLLGAAWAATLALLVAAHRVARLPYPLERTGLYFIPLFILSIVAAGRSRSRAVRAVATAALTILALTSLEQFTLSSYASWRFDAGSRQIAELIARWPIDRPLKVATSHWQYQPALDFYRTVRFPNRLAEIEDGFDASDIARFDFLVVNDEDEATIKSSWRRLFTHPISGAHVLVNPGLR